MVVEAVATCQQIEAALPTEREVLERGLITLTDVALYEPEA
jgi:PII-like signaling protein